MKNLYRAFIGVTVISLVLFNACTPEDVIVEDLSVKLTQESWTFSSVVGESDQTTNWYMAFYENDIITFKTDGTCTNNQLAEIGIGTWSINSNQTVLTINIAFPSGDTRNETWDIKTISNSELSYSFINPPNPLEMTYTH